MAKKGSLRPFGVFSSFIRLTGSPAGNTKIKIINIRGIVWHR